jgi:V/A-type H+-transporting ATPase subunit I
VIVEMSRIRVLGPRPKLDVTVRALQDSGVVHLIDAEDRAGIRRVDVDPIARRRSHHLARVLGEIERALAGLAELGSVVPDRTGAPPPEGIAARVAARVATAVESLRTRARELVEERDALRAYEPLFTELTSLLRDPSAPIFMLRLHRRADLEALRSALERLLGVAVTTRARELATGETVVLLQVPAGRGAEVERHLAGAGVERAPLPAALARSPIADALARMQPRLSEVELELESIHDRAAALARAHGDDLARARAGFHDALLALAAEERAAATARAFVIEGWLPAGELPALTRMLGERVGPELAIELVARDQWHGDDPPVVLTNPRIFAPFELLTSLLPLPKYGTVDPTPFVAVFFPVLFGLVVGDVGYGLVIALLAVILRLSGPRARGVSKIATAAAACTLAFGVLYGEMFGDLGTRWFGMHAIWFDRREAVMSFLVLAIGIGVAHLLLGLIVAAVTRWRAHRREALGRGITAMMLVLVTLALLAMFHEVPDVLLRPAVIALLIALPVVVILEGMTALFDFMAILGHVLSYARVMALGTASVMLAVVANQMSGAFGSAALGIAFALVFHIVNFAITLFSPTIHVMRLHYVEFFGTFFEPGGAPYRPLRHWSPGAH